MRSFKKKPNRSQLLGVIEELQSLIGEARMHGENDRDPDGFSKARRALEEAHELCIDARSFDPPNYSGEFARVRASR